MPLQKPANSQGTLAKGTIGLLLVGVVAAAMVVAARRPAANSNEAAAADMQMQMEQPQVAPVAQPVVPAKKPAAGKPATTGKSSPKMTVLVAQSSSTTPKPANDVATISTQPTDPEMTAPVQESAKLAPPAASPVTIAGCLERDGTGFALKETTGTNAPKARSWKSGFLKKGSANIELFDAGNRLKFKDHVGHRVSVTGVLNDREMQARSLQRVSGACE